MKSFPIKTNNRQRLEIKSAFIYFSAMIVITAVALTLQIIANVNIAGIIPPLIYCLIILSLAFHIYKKKKKGKEPVYSMWVIAVLAILMPFITRLNYIFDANFSSESWTFALESTNTAILILAMIVIQQLLFNKKIALFSIIFGIGAWIIFIIAAIMNGAEYSIYAMDTEGNFVHNFILLREIYVIVISLLISYLFYRYIPVLDDYDRRSARDKKSIENRKIQLEKIVKTVEKLSDELSKFSENAKKESEELKENASEQAANLEEIVTAMEEMGELVTSTAEMSEETNGITQNTSVQAIEGKAVVEKTIAAVQDITEKITFIDSIAGLTDILAINAAVQAANAGEAGKSFAVVAKEVRQLADKSKETAKIIHDAGKENMEISEKLLTIFETIMPNAEKAAEMMLNTKNSTAEQSSGINQINSALQQLNMVTQSNAGSAESLACISESLFNLSNELYAVLHERELNGN